MVYSTPVITDKFLATNWAAMPVRLLSVNADSIVPVAHTVIVTVKRQNYAHVAAVALSSISSEWFGQKMWFSCPQIMAWLALAYWLAMRDTGCQPGLATCDASTAVPASACG